MLLVLLETGYANILLTVNHPPGGKDMDDLKSLIPVSYDNPERPTVSGRELHEFLEVNTPYRIWFPRMVEYGFTEGEDFNPYKNVRVQSEGNREVERTIDDHQLTIPMAKELCMIQRNERGKQARQYFLAVEAQWNSPEGYRVSR
jgi:bacteriophage antirepressor